MSLMALGYFERDISCYLSPLSVVVMRQHQEIEESISPYLLDLYLLESDYELIRETVNNSEDSLLLRLDVMRNQLLLANTLITIVAVNLAFGSFVSGIFGMNLDNTRNIEPMKDSFITVTVVTIAVMFIFTAISILILIRNGMLPMFTIFSFCL
jgi:Mg2+ and Co2+ transporter CorA